MLELGLRLGSQELESQGLFIIEIFLDKDANDLIIIECIESIGKLVHHKLISLKQQQKLLEKTLDYLWLPNKRIRQRICQLVLVIQQSNQDSFHVQFMPIIQ